MRIGQLARKISVPPSDIVAYLTSRQIELESGINTRLTPELVQDVVTRFAPQLLTELVAAAEEEEQPAPEPVVQEADTVVEEVLHTAIPPIAVDEPAEVIRAPKVELQGLKVLGKIDLPEPKKKAAPTEEELPKEQPSRPQQRRREERPWKNPLEQKRKQEQREAKRKRQEEAEKEKERRTLHYQKKVKSVPTKPVRKTEETVVEELLDTAPPPKTIIGKFLRWLRT